MLILENLEVGKYLLSIKQFDKEITIKVIEGEYLRDS